MRRLIVLFGSWGRVPLRDSSQGRIRDGAGFLENYVNNDHAFERLYRQALIKDGEQITEFDYYTLVRVEGVYFYSGFMFFYNLGRMGKMPGTVQEIRYINRDENTYLWLFRSMILELRKEEPDLFTEDKVAVYEDMIREGVEQEIRWGAYVLGDDIPGLRKSMVEDYIRYLGNQRSMGLGFRPLYEGYRTEPDSMKWVSEYADPNLIKTDFFEGKPSAYSKASVIEDDL